MNDTPLTIRSFPQAILHIDGDAFFASCEQARNPKLQGKPVITGKERGIAASMSYEAKALGVTRAMSLRDIRKLIPNAIILPSDYETYSLLSKRLYAIVRRYTSEVEEYGIDECFADLTGMRRTLRMSYPQIAEKIQNELATELGFTFSLGLGPNKVIAKIGSKWNKPHGLTVIPGRYIHKYIEKMPTEKIWGIGPQTSAFLAKKGILTALQFARQSEAWVAKNLSKPFYEIWQELNGVSVMPLQLEEHTEYQSIQKFKTFTPPSAEREFIFAQLSKNIESACIKARRYKLAPKEALFILRLQDFRHAAIEVKLSRITAFSHEIIATAEKVFDEIYKPGILYRSTGVVLMKLEEDIIHQPDLFGSNLKVEKIRRVYEAVDQLKNWYGKHTVYLGSSHKAQVFQQHEGERGKAPERKSTLLKGESKRKRLGIPMLMAEVK